MKQYYGFWLIFEEEESNQLRSIIQEFSKEKLDGQIFEPHLSVYPAVLSKLDFIKENLQKISVKYSKFSVETDGYDMEEKWSKTLYIKIKENQILTNINQELQNIYSENLEIKNDYQPHVSLIYKLGMKREEKVKLMDQVSIPDRLLIKSIGVVDPGVKDDNWKDFSKWSIPYSIELC